MHLKENIPQFSFNRCDLDHVNEALAKVAAGGSRGKTILRIQ